MNRFTIFLLCALAYNVPGTAQSKVSAEADSVLKTVQLLPATVSAIQAPERAPFPTQTVEAVDLAKNMIELPQHPTYNHLGKRGSSSNYGRLRLVETLIQYEQWDQLIDLAESPYLAQSEVIQAELIRQKALATAWYQKGNMEKVKEVRASLVSLRVSEKQRRSEAIDNAEEEAINASKNDKEVNEAMEKAMTGFKNPLRLLRESIQLTDLYLALLEENHDTAKELVKKVKGVNKVDLAQIYHALGDDEEALKQLEDAIKNIPGQVHPHARAAELFLALDKKEKATDTFESLRKIAGALDRDVPIAQRMDKLAADLGYNSDWVIPFETADDVGQRPSLDSLGPFRWAPYEAPSWELPDAKGESVSSLEFEKKPTLLVFYLGFGCSHCVRQLAVIEPETDKFKELGINIAAVSTETIEELAASNKASEILGSLSFPLMADPQLRVFKQFRAYDDFEQTPLHGTFLIDGEGKVRWQDISYEPFTDIEFLLKESKRLLSQPKATDLAGGIE